MSEQGPDVESARAYLDTLTGQLERLVRDGPEIARKASELVHTQTSPDGLVSVTVDSRGTLLSLDLDPRIYRKPDSRALADVITETIQEATTAVRTKVVDVLEPLGDREQFEVIVTGDLDEAMDNLSDRMTNWDR